MKYGTNLAISIIAAVLIAVLLNWIAFKLVAPIDLTRSGRYSLSPQTEKVLGSLDDKYEIVTLLAADGQQFDDAVINSAIGLVRSYESSSDNISVESINPLYESSKLDAFFLRLAERYEGQLQSPQAAIEAGLSMIEKVEQHHAGMLETARDLQDNPEQDNLDLSQYVVDPIHNQLVTWATEFPEQRQAIRTRLDEPLPPYGQVLTELQTAGSRLDRIYKAVIQSIDKVLAADRPASVREDLLKLKQQVQAAIDDVEPTLNELRAAQVPPAYTDLRTRLYQRQQTIVVIGPNDVQVLLGADLFRLDQAAQEGAQGAPTRQFLGEEKITGTLARMSLDKRPMVVFVYAGPPPLGQGQPFTTYNQVGERLRAMNFDVRQWTPLPQTNPMTGQPGQPQPMPEPEPGQPAIWIMLPLQGFNPQNPAAGMVGQQIITKLEERLAAGDSALFILKPADTAGMSMGMGAVGIDPLVQAVEPYGVLAQTDRIVHREAVISRRETRAVTEHPINSWPDESPITKALAGLQGVVAMGMPLELKSPEGANLKPTPLIVVEGDAVFAPTDFRGDTPPKRDPATAKDRYIVGASVETGSNRIVVIGDQVFATDYLTTLGMLGPNTAELTGARYPANSELFVNSVYWLAGLDQLIAASPRSQDIARVEAIPDGTLKTIRIVLPFAIVGGAIAVGIAVFFRRRMF